MRFLSTGTNIFSAPVAECRRALITQVNGAVVDAREKQSTTAPVDAWSGRCRSRIVSRAEHRPCGASAPTVEALELPIKGAVLDLLVGRCPEISRAWPI